MSWFFRVLETPDETWRCRFGKDDFGEHPTLYAAIEQITLISTPFRPATLFVHWLDGTVSNWGEIRGDGSEPPRL